MKIKFYIKNFIYVLKNVCNKLNINFILGFWWEIILVLFL